MSDNLTAKLIRITPALNRRIKDVAKRYKKTTGQKNQHEFIEKALRLGMDLIEEKMILGEEVAHADE